MPTVDFNPAGKQAAWKLTDSWLTDGKPLGMNPSIVSWDGSKEHSFSGQKGAVTGVDHQSPYAPTWAGGRSTRW